MKTAEWPHIQYYFKTKLLALLADETPFDEELFRRVESMAYGSNSIEAQERENMWDSEDEEIKQKGGRAWIVCFNKEKRKGKRENYRIDRKVFRKGSA